MEMEFMAEFTEGMSRDRARQIIKRKRTKRHRPCSPFAAVSTTSGDTDYCLIDNSFAASDTSTEEDEDMANCLIMLAQSVSPVKEEEKSDQIRQKTERLRLRLSSRRISEIAGGSKPGLYVYECKTCNRTFPSFQALGGHRASHKKPKLNVEEKKSIHPPPLMEYVEEEEVQDQRRVVEDDEENKASIIVTNNVQKLSSSSGFVQTGIIINSNSKGGKVHECSICGSEFLSGQALGGHMRKHRPIPPSGNRTVISISINTDQIIEKSPERSSGMLSLDLNFPPPEVADDHHHQSKFQFTAGSSSSSSQHQHLVFSAPAFVDCHY